MSDQAERPMAAEHWWGDNCGLVRLGENGVSERGPVDRLEFAQEILRLRAERDAALASSRESEKSEEKLIIERDMWYEGVDRLADALGVEEEWTNQTHRGQIAEEHAFGLIAERDRYKALAGRQRELLAKFKVLIHFVGQDTGPGLDALRVKHEIDEVFADPDGLAALREWELLRKTVRDQREICEREATRGTVAETKAMRLEARGRVMVERVRSAGCICRQTRELDWRTSAWSAPPRKGNRPAHPDPRCPIALAASLEEILGGEGESPAEELLGSVKAVEAARRARVEAERVQGLVKEIGVTSDAFFGFWNSQPISLRVQLHKPASEYAEEAWGAALAEFLRRYGEGQPEGPGLVKTAHALGVLRGLSNHQWRPMESAPRDETRILVDFGRIGVHAVSWILPQAWNDGSLRLWCVDDRKHGPYPLRGYVDSDVKGWMPLPESAPEVPAPEVVEGREGQP